MRVTPNRRASQRIASGAGLRLAGRTVRSLLPQDTCIGNFTTAPQAFCREQDKPVHDQESGRDQRGGKPRADGFLQHQAEDTGRNRCDNKQPAKFRVGVPQADFPVPDGSAQALEDFNPIFAKKR